MEIKAFPPPTFSLAAQSVRVLQIDIWTKHDAKLNVMLYTLNNTGCTVYIWQQLLIYRDMFWDNLPTFLFLNKKAAWDIKNTN